MLDSALHSLNTNGGGAERGAATRTRHVLADTVRSGVVVVARALADLLAIVAGFACSYASYAAAIEAGLLVRDAPEASTYFTIVPLFTLLVLSVFVQLGLYQRRASILNLWELQTVIKGLALAAVLLFSMLFFLKLTDYSRIVVIGGLIVTTAFMLLERRLLAALLGTLYQLPRWSHRVLICGCGDTGQLLMKKIVQSPQLGWTVVGFLDDRARRGSVVACRVAQGGPVAFQAPVLGTLRQLADVVAHHDVDEVLVTVPNAPERLRELFQTARARRLRIGVVPHLEHARADQLEIEDVSAIPVLRSSALSRKTVSSALKRLFDLVVASALTLATAPLWILAVIATRLDSPGPIFFVQRRVGLDGREFHIFKFRSMRSDADAYGRSPHGDDQDPRITRVGRFLRKTGIDELPQLLNVLRGEMSMVGPRPEMPFLVEQYGAMERQRLLVKPGITGLWQLGADRHAEIHENLEYDLYYIAHQSLLLDALILLETVFFTIAQAARALRRTREPIVLATDAVANAIDAPYLVVALDQRQRGSLLESWHRSLAHLRAVAPFWAIKVLMASQNIAQYQRLMDESQAELQDDLHRIEFVVIESRSEIRDSVANAELVLTDLPNVAEWARRSGVGVIPLGDSEPQVVRKSGDAEIYRSPVLEPSGIDPRDPQRWT